MKLFRNLVLWLSILLLPGGPCVLHARQRQEQPKAAPSQPQDEASCTDLSGKNPEPCPTDAEPAAGPPADGASSVPDSGAEVSPESDTGSRSDSTPSGSSEPSGVKPAVMKSHAASSSAAPAAAEGEPGAASSTGSASQMETVDSEDAGETTQPVQPAGFLSLERTLPRNLLVDQKNFWTSPLRIRVDDVKTLFPFLVVTGLVIGNDRGIESHVPLSWKDRGNKISNYGAAGFAGMVGGAYLWGKIRHNDHLAETGFLAGEAAVSSLGIAEGIKLIAGRDRPLEGNQQGDFFNGGQSFPSQHAAAAFSIATVVAHEYPGPLTKFLAYGGAGAIAAARVSARQHWTSDVLVGSALGWLVGEQVSHAHMREAADTANYGTFVKSESEARNPADMGSPSVPLDSWIYPVFDRLSGMGYIHSAFMGLRPWTRMECARLVAEAGQSLGADDGSPSWTQADELYKALSEEFTPELARGGGARNLGAGIESIYTRVTGISGQPLNDSYHFGQTLINDYGRPYREGANLVTGFSSNAVAGPLSFYVRAEYQHAPSAPALSDSVRQVIASVDANPLQPGAPFSTVNQVQFLDSYVGITIKNTQLTFGKQSLWWGPGEGGSLMLTDNAEPFNMVRWTNVSPVRLPSIFGWLGPMRFDSFFGRLDGHQFPPRPFFYGQQISFKPTPNLEVGFSRTAVFAGEGLTPLTARTFFHSFFSVTSSDKGTRMDPGKRSGGFNFSYRLPGLRNWVTLYTDSLSSDDPSPLAAPRRAAMNPGFYLSHVPKIPKLDFRAEAVFTDVTAGRSVGGSFIYWDFIYHDLYLNNGNILGSWIGREGRGLQLSSTYRFSPQTDLQFGYRNAQVNHDFIPWGGTQNNFWGSADLAVRHDLTVSPFVQYEHWTYPVLAPLPQSNFTISLQVTYRPQWRIWK